jgi:hypothetical protein
MDETHSSRCQTKRNFEQRDPTLHDFTLSKHIILFCFLQNINVHSLQHMINCDPDENQLSIDAQLAGQIN